MQKQEERPDDDAESVFSESEEEGEVLGGRRDVASDAEDEGDADAKDDAEGAAGERKTPVWPDALLQDDRRKFAVLPARYDILFTDLLSSVSLFHVWDRQE